MAFPEPDDRSSVSRRFDAQQLRGSLTGLKLGLGRIGFHTFRHTYRAWLDEIGAPVGVQQKLLKVRS
jgi:integrase